MLHAHLAVLSSIELEVLPIRVLHCGNRELRAFCNCDLDLDPMTFIYKLNQYPLKISSQTKSNLSTPRFSKVIVLHTYTQTDRQTDATVNITTQLRGW